MCKTAKYISTQTTKLFLIISRILLWIREPCHESAAQQFDGSNQNPYIWPKIWETTIAATAYKKSASVKIGKEAVQDGKWESDPRLKRTPSIAADDQDADNNVIREARPHDNTVSIRQTTNSG